jgi:hypothetical protein
MNLFQIFFSGYMDCKFSYFVHPSEGKMDDGKEEVKSDGEEYADVGEFIDRSGEVKQGECIYLKRDVSKLFRLYVFTFVSLYVNNLDR